MLFGKRSSQTGSIKVVTKNDNNYTEKEEFNLSEIILEVILSENLKVLLCIVTDSQPQG